jgi:hypothetical protein
MTGVGDDPRVALSEFLDIYVTELPQVLAEFEE